ncbi:alpha-L-fucosidase [Sphingomonas endophytica]|uniref:alpha-L-fucosidase n=1 Tax=Sphingomonas endophytica TaxID=869719 RepID=A0A147I6E5_9SPHN|nr:alpha-L-fucosidase [Sphingomonas endophytica]KTT74255.1 alpha-L-fucosidase [Sphingomonas endophytica]
MKVTRRQALGTGVAAGALATAPGAATAQTAGCTIGTHPGNRAVAVRPPRAFTPDWRSLTAGYSVPDWFRDAKFGMWAHWTAQCVPAAGDWYARNMYLQGSSQYEHHLKHYGHPADQGFMEIQNLWKGERWDPAGLLDLYKKAGAKYFMALANHHDNLDCYASTYHPWNTTRVGPKRDIVGIWEKLARERGMRFAVSNHSAHAWHWNQAAYGYDPEGARRGQRYDAFRLTAADGKGKWWEGLDPQQLYTGRGDYMPDGVPTIAEADAWHAAHDRMWDEGTPPNPEFVRTWFLRCRELIDRYKPDMVYFDNFDLPLEQAGLDITAYFYNRSMAWNNGRLEAVVTGKNIPPQRRMGIVDDVERGGKTYIERFPWQTDTCIGEWHYDQAVYDNDRYKSAATVIHTLCDVISKNGNLMLNVPLRGDGTIDDKEQRIVEGIAAWMGRYGDAIYGTRPWRIHGEGPQNGGGGLFSEGGPKSLYTAKDIRYVTKGKNLHAFVLGWPENGVARLTLLGRDNQVGRGTIERVMLSGSDAPLQFQRNGDALQVTLPAAARNDIGVALIIAGSGLTEGSVA